MSTRDLVLWSILAWLWGSSFLAIRIGVESVAPATLVAGRMAIGATILIAIIVLRGGTLHLGRRGWSIAVVVGLSGNVIPFLLISYAEQQVHSGLAALIMAIAPIITLTAAPMVHPEETLTGPKVAGGLLGLAGVVLLVGPHSLSGVGQDLLPQIALLAAAGCYAFTALFSRRFPHHDPLQMAAGSVLVGAAFIGVGVLASGESAPLSQATPQSLTAIAYLGVGPTACAAAIYFLLIPRIGAARLQQVNYVVPVLGVLLGLVFLGERPDWNTWLAIPIILTAVYCVNRRDHPAIRRRFQWR